MSLSPHVVTTGVWVLKSHPPLCRLLHEFSWFLSEYLCASAGVHVWKQPCATVDWKKWIWGEGNEGPRGGSHHITDPIFLFYAPRCFVALERSWLNISRRKAFLEIYLNWGGSLPVWAVRCDNLGCKMRRHSNGGRPGAEGGTLAGLGARAPKHCNCWWDNNYLSSSANQGNHGSSLLAR